MMEKKFLTDLLERKNDPSGILKLFSDAGLSSTYLDSIKSKTNPQFPYSRNVLHSDERIEIMLANWTPRLSCSPHDHGVSSGWVFYLKGNFVEANYQWIDQVLTLQNEIIHSEGTFIDVSDESIHSCMSLKEGLSLHVYFPRITSMRVHDIKNRRTYVVADDCGAWIPHSKEDIKEELPWQIPLSAVP